MSKVEQSIRHFLERHFFWIIVGVLLFLSMQIRASLAPNLVSYDYTSFCKCIDSFKANGFVGGLKIGLGMYFTPYNLLLALFAILPFEPYNLIALSSGIGDYVSAFFISLIAYELLKRRQAKGVHGVAGLSEDDIQKRSVMIGLVMVFLPVVSMNSALWKQCEGIYTCFCVISIYYLIKEKYNAAFIWYAIAFTIKLQVIFLLPVFIILYICGKKFSIGKFLWIPFIYFLAGLPSVLAGRSIVSTYTVYIGQTTAFPRMTFNYPNIYQFALPDYTVYSKPAIVFTLSIFVAASYFIYARRKRLDGEAILALSVWAQWTCVMFLPGMHDRYDYQPIVLLTAFILIVVPKYFPLAVGINLMAITVYCKYLYDMEPIPFVYLAAFNLGAYLFFTYLFVRYLSIDKMGEK